MAQLALDNKLLASISALAERLKVSKQDLIKRAVRNYEESIATENRLMPFAGILEEEEADELLDTIYSNRSNKQLEPQI